ncbi:hypothetical protein [Microbacterium album]|uniref:DUF4386 family protein n=1 Tax=Microbacterium album TaxID=2053191 RepID=A0A917IG74_9MICO|nr:hypothetical protein [Microbacterium album]GGH40700.1 hypothetical protein GCM10010921_12800 [Microbacterium album]
MSSTPDLARPHASRSNSAAPRGRRFVAWPLWATLAGAAGAIGTVGTDLRPAAETAAWQEGRDYIVTSADMAGLDPALGRIGYSVGLLAILALIVFAAAWRRHVEQRFAGSIGARVVSVGLVASAGALVLGYGWRGALANYLGPEAGLYDSEGLFVYYMLTDFGAYLPWTGVLVSAFGLAWMAWAERSVSRILGGFTTIAAAGALLLVLISGVPGLPGVFMPAWLAVTGIWLAVGRSRVAEREDAR